jgi:hypothetical protein
MKKAPATNTAIDEECRAERDIKNNQRGQLGRKNEERDKPQIPQI